MRIAAGEVSSTLLLDRYDAHSMQRNRLVRHSDDHVVPGTTYSTKKQYDDRSSRSRILLRRMEE